MNIADRSYWEFRGATLVQHLDNGAVVPNGAEGQLYVTLANNKTGEEKRGTVCYGNNFNIQTAGFFCQYMGYQVEEPFWGINPPAYKYVPGYVECFKTQYHFQLRKLQLIYI